MCKEIIRITDLRREFMVGDEKVKALRGVSFTINEGEFVTIMGTSGSGKSTLLNILGCLDTPTSGDYYLDGENVRDMSKNRRALTRNRKIGFVFQNYNLLPKTTAVENVELPLLYRNSTAKSRREAAEKVLEKVGLSHRMRHLPTQLSGGQCQRVALARAIVGNPQIILADEPTGNLDSKMGSEIMELLFQLNEDGTTIVMVTHDEHIAESTQRIVRFFDGRRVE